jgi:hypothetical protein
MGQMVHSNFVNLWLSSGDETDFFGVKDEKNYALWFGEEKKLSYQNLPRKFRTRNLNTRMIM